MLIASAHAMKQLPPNSGCAHAASSQVKQNCNTCSPKETGCLRYNRCAYHCMLHASSEDVQDVRKHAIKHSAHKQHLQRKAPHLTLSANLAPPVHLHRLLLSHLKQLLVQAWRISRTTLLLHTAQLLQHVQLPPLPLLQLSHHLCSK